MKEKLMILGASYSQIPLMKAAKRLGYTAVAVSIPGDYQGFAHADEIVYADITDPEAVLEAARTIKPAGIATCCMDVGIRALGYACEKLGLAGPGIFATKAACDKSIEKEAYVRCGVRTAPYCLVHNEEELASALEKLHFPIILKAVDQMGSRGIQRADTPKEALDAFAYAMAATSKDFCIAEEFIEGTMFGVEAMMSKGELVFCLPMANVMKQGNPTFPIGHSVPWGCSRKLQEEIRVQTAAVAKALGFDDCGMDLDCMYKDGKIYIIEATARAGATCITDTVSIYYGIDYYEALVKAALGLPVSDMFTGEQVPRMPSETRLLSSADEGIVEEIIVPDVLPEQIRELSFNIGKGSHVQPMKNGRDRIGQLIAAGDTPAECSRAIDTVMKEIRLVLQGKSGGEIC